MTERLNHFNYMNVMGFALSWVLNSGAVGNPDNEAWNLSFLGGMEELSRRYESLVTPASVTFLIAHLILLVEGVFTVCQLLPRYRSTVMVQEGVRFWFFLSAVAQFFWSLDLNVENIFGSILSTVFMGIMFYCLSMILMAQASLTETQGGEQTSEEYWLLRFPFSIHCGWVFAVFVMSINAWFVQFEVPGLVQFILGVFSLLGLAAVGFKMLYANGRHPNYVIPSILSWFAFGIALMEQGPKVELEGIIGFIFSALALILGATLAVNTIYLFYFNEYLYDIEDKKIAQEVHSETVPDDTVYVNASALA